MHEYSLVQALLDRVRVEAERHGAVSVQRIELSIGELAGVEMDLFEAAFETFRSGSICSEAKLAVRPVPARWQCPACDRDLAAGEILRCPACGEPARLAAGDEIILERLEMEATRDV